MRSSLIGHTGFVGSNLARSEHFDRHFNSKTISEIRGETFDRIVCAGVSAVKWWANQNPEEDLHRIQGLMDCLKDTRCGQFVLISTIDVFGKPIGMTETDDPRATEMHAYGRNRLILEDFVRDQFSRCTIVRLPGLFGPGLRKNVIFDMINQNQLAAINPESRFQWYSVERLSADLATIESKGIELVNIVSEPVATREIRDRFFPALELSGTTSSAMLYDNRTNFPALFGGSGPYHYSAAQTMTDLAAFVEHSHVD